MLKVFLASIFIAFANSEVSTWGGLYPRESESREVKSLDGMWNFRLSPLHEPNLGFQKKWYSQELAKVCTRN